MIYIKEIGYYLPDNEVSNIARMEQFALEENFLLQKIGMTHLKIKNPEEETSDMCVKAYLDLQARTPFDNEEIDCLIVCTQNPDVHGLPHTSAIVHAKLSLNQSCAVFDISLGCSGYVYGLSIAKSFMQANGFQKGVFITADPYSKVIDENDRNTTLLFGDAATATLLTRAQPNVWSIGQFSFGSDGRQHQAIQVNKSKKLVMNGREVFNFAAKVIPVHIKQTVQKNNLSIEMIDQFILHQGSKYIITMIQQQLGITDEKIPFLATQYGNTVSSSIPMLLKDVAPKHRRLLICGFGIGFSWGSCILERVD